MILNLILQGYFAAKLRCILRYNEVCTIYVLPRASNVWTPRRADQSGRELHYSTCSRKFTFVHTPGCHALHGSVQ